MRNTLLRAARRYKGWKQQQLADFTELSVSTIERAERGEQISGESMQRLCTCLQKTPEQLGLLQGMYEDQAFPASHKCQGHFISSSQVSTSGPVRTTQQNIIEYVGVEEPPGEWSECASAFKRARDTCPPASDFSVSSLVDVVQLSQTGVYEQASDKHDMFLPSESEIIIPPGPSVQMLSLTTARIDLPTWFGLQVNNLKAIGASWQGSYQQQQASIHAELEKWNSMVDQDYQSTNEYRITRRTALATLAMLSTRLLTTVQSGSLSALVVEEFLSQCIISITACYHLLSGDGLATVEYALPNYLPLLRSLAKQPSPYQRRAAYIAAQGCWIMGLVSLHKLRFKERVAYGKQSVEFARLSGDRTLLVMLLASLGNSWYNVGQKAVTEQKPQETDLAYARMLQAYQEAANILTQPSSDVPSLLHSKVFAGLAHAYAQHAAVQNALQWIAKARSVFSEESEEVPSFLSTDYGIYQVILFEGLTFLDLDKHNPTGGYGKQAWKMLEQIEHLPSTIHVPERFRIEIINQRTRAAINIGNLEAFRIYLMSGAQGAKELQSQKRQQEAIANWKAARARWPHEQQIWELADVLME